MDRVITNVYRKILSNQPNDKSLEIGEINYRLRYEIPFYSVADIAYPNNPPKIMFSSVCKVKNCLADHLPAMQKSVVSMSS